MMTKLQDTCTTCGAFRRVHGDGERTEWIERGVKQILCSHDELVCEDVEPVEHDRDWSNYEQ